MNLQQIFTTIKNHLLTQGEKSLNLSNDTCLYKSPSGLTCAIGCLIKDEHYNLSLEGKVLGFDEGVEEVISKSINTPVTSVMSDLLCHLQTIHDVHPVATWEGELRVVANRFSLTY